MNTPSSQPLAICAILAIGSALMPGAASAQAGWLPDASHATIPHRPASGRIGGQTIMVEKVEITISQGATGRNLKSGFKYPIYTIRFRQGKDFFADRELILTLALKAGQTLNGLHLQISPAKFGSPEADKQPHATYSDGTGIPVVQGIQTMYKLRNLQKGDPILDKYSFNLQFAHSNRDTLPGKIYICLPDKTHSFIAGTFVAHLHLLGSF